LDWLAEDDGNLSSPHNDLNFTILQKIIFCFCDMCCGAVSHVLQAESKSTLMIAMSRSSRRLRFPMWLNSRLVMMHKSPFLMSHGGQHAVSATSGRSVSWGVRAHLLLVSLVSISVDCFNPLSSNVSLALAPLALLSHSHFWTSDSVQFLVLSAHRQGPTSECRG
jgi:hypothetical protein